MALTPKVAVLLPTYDGAAFLAPQLDSILGQSLGELEVIAVDDGSRDDTVEILHDYARRDARVTVRADGRNLGQKARLAEALAASSAPYVAMSDQDDLWSPEKLARLASHLDAGAMMAFGPSHLIDAEGRDLGVTVLDALGAAYDPQCTLASLFRPIVSAHAALVKREGVSPLALGREAIPFDWLMALDAIYSDGLVYDEAAGVRHRLHGGNQMNGETLADRDRAAAQGGRLRPWQWRRGLRRIVADRVKFLTCVEHLANSSIVPNETARTFRRVHKDCWGAWFNHWRPSGYAKTLETNTAAALRPFSAGSRDLAFFSTRFHQLQYTPPHPQALAVFIARTRRADHYQG